MGLFSQGQALIVGVGGYADPQWDAPTARRDAAALHAALVDPLLGAYPPGQAELLLDPGRDALRAGLRRLADRAGPDDTALIAFTGHGAPGEDGLYYLATSDAGFTAGGQVARDSGLHVAELSRALAAIRARQLLLVVNACFAGHVDGRVVGAVLPDSDGNSLLASGAGRAIITASRRDQRSYFRPGDEQSIFGQALVDALRGTAETAGGATLGVFELYAALSRQVRAAAARLRQAQEPALSIVEQAGPFPVARMRGGAGPELPLRATPGAEGAVRVVPTSIVSAIGAGATAIQAAEGATVTVDQSSRLVDIGQHNQIGSISIGTIVGGNMVGPAAPAAAPASADPLADLPALHGLVATARNVDEDARDEAALRIQQAMRALGQGDRAKARQRLGEALALLDPLPNPYMRTLAGRLRRAHDALG